MLATFAPTIASITRELEEMMASTGASVEIVTRHATLEDEMIVLRDILLLRHVHDAMLLLGKGDGDAHDSLIAAEARKLPGTCS